MNSKQQMYQWQPDRGTSVLWYWQKGLFVEQKKIKGLHVKSKGISINLGGPWLPSAAAVLRVAYGYQIT